MGRLKTMAAALALFMVLVPLASVGAVEITRVVSPGGIEAWLIEDRGGPVIALEWAFEGAGANDPKGKEGRATLAADTLDEGAGPYDSQAFQARLQDLAVSLKFEAGRDALTGSLRMLADTRDEAVALAGLSMREPRFDADAVARVRDQLASELRRDQGDPSHVARRLFYATAFPGHPYGAEPLGTPEGLAALTPEDLRAFTRDALGRDRLVVAAAGAISPTELGLALDQLFAGLPAASRLPPIADVAPQGAGQTLVRQRPTAQTVVLMGQTGVKRDDPDWYAASVLNYVLGGGGFNSRLMEEVREKRGLSYGVYSYLLPFDHAAVVLAGGSTVNAKAGETLAIMREVWERTRRDGIGAEDLARAKTFLTGSFPLQFTSTSAIARILVQIKRDRLGIDYLARRDALFNAVTLDDVRRVARTLLDPARLLTVLVGQPQGVTDAKASGE